MSIFNTKYPFDPLIRHHVYIAVGLAVWVFAFLYFTEPLDVNDLPEREKMIYLPIYGLIGGVCYSLFIPFQNILYGRAQKRWTIGSEMLFLITFFLVCGILSRLYYLYVIVAHEPNPYTLDYYITDILFPAFTIILPMLLIARFAFGKYKEKKLEQAKIEIKGEGNYDGLRLLLSDLISIKSANNYIEVYYYAGKDVKKSLIRNKLSSVAEEFPQLVRAHRSYIINPDHFQQWKTENGKLFAELSSSVLVPISTTYKNDVKERINSTTNS